MRASPSLYFIPRRAAPPDVWRPKRPKDLPACEHTDSNCSEDIFEAELNLSSRLGAGDGAGVVDVDVDHRQVEVGDVGGVEGLGAELEFVLAQDGEGLHQG